MGKKKAHSITKSANTSKHRQSEGQSSTCSSEASKGPSVKSKGKQASWGSEDRDGKRQGCNCPTGCLKGEPIPASGRSPSDGVYVRCSNGSCSGVPWLHEECYDKWERHLIKVMMNTNGKARGFTESLYRKNLWNIRFYDLIHQECRCPTCNGRLMREIAEEKFRDAAGSAASIKPQKASSKPVSNSQKKKELPKLQTVRQTLFQLASGVPASAVKVCHVPQRERIVLQRNLEDNGSHMREISEGSERNETEDEETDVHTQSLSDSEFIDSTDSSSNVVGSKRTRNVVDGESEEKKKEVKGAHKSGSEAVPTSQPVMSKEIFLRELERAVRTFGNLSQTDVVFCELMDRVGESLLTEMLAVDGFPRWLLRSSETLRVIRGAVTLEGSQNEFRGVGTVRQLMKGEDGTLNQGLIQLNRVNFYGTEWIWFDSLSTITDTTTQLVIGDEVTFSAVETECPIKRCNWAVVEMSVVPTPTEFPPNPYRRFRSLRTTSVESGSSYQKHLGTKDHLTRTQHQYGAFSTPQLNPYAVLSEVTETFHPRSSVAKVSQGANWRGITLEQTSDWEVSGTKNTTIQEADTAESLHEDDYAHLLDKHLGESTSRVAQKCHDFSEWEKALEDLMH